jgi:hypothetical protein
MLVDAHDKDKIAHLLHISPHTVKDYMKAIYKHFDVSSQLELIHRFRFGDAGDETTQQCLGEPVRVHQDASNVRR